MSATSRRRFLISGSISAIAAPFILTRNASAADFTYKLGHDYSVDHPNGTRTVEAAQKIRERTSGRLDIQIFPNSQLGSGTEMLTPVRSGGVEFFMFTSVQLGNIAPGAAVSGIGFAFPEYDRAWKAMDGALGARMHADIAKAGVVPMRNVWEIGFRNVSTNIKAINTAADLAGLKIRVAVSPLYVSLWKALGAAPTSMNFAELYSALQTKLVNGADVPINVMLTQNLFEVTNYLSLTNHMWDGVWIVANPAAWQRLPESMREIVEEEFNAAALRGRQDILKSESNDVETLKSKGLKINKADASTFRTKLQQAGFYKEWKSKFNPELWKALEDAAGGLT